MFAGYFACCCLGFVIGLFVLLFDYLICWWLMGFVVGLFVWFLFLFCMVVWLLFLYLLVVFLVVLLLEWLVCWCTCVCIRFPCWNWCVYFVDLRFDYWFCVLFFVWLWFVRFVYLFWLGLLVVLTRLYLCCCLRLFCLIDLDSFYLAALMYIIYICFA